jgi:hypothetical protein
MSHRTATLTEIYIEALLVDEDLADQVWEAWGTGEIDDVVTLLGLVDSRHCVTYFS